MHTGCGKSRYTVVPPYRSVNEITLSPVLMELTIYRSCPFSGRQVTKMQERKRALRKPS